MVPVQGFPPLAVHRVPDAERSSTAGLSACHVRTLEAHWKAALRAASDPGGSPMAGPGVTTHFDHVLVTRIGGSADVRWGPGKPETSDQSTTTIALHWRIPACRTLERQGIEEPARGILRRQAGPMPRFVAIV